jgi:fucose permease
MFAYASSVAATPIILIQIATELQFNLAEGGGIEAVRTGFLLAILLASGAASKWLGTQRTLGYGALLLGLGLTAYALAPSYLVVLFAIVLVGLGGGVLEALLNPLVQDAHPDDSGRYLNLVNAFFSVGVLTSMLIVGDLLTRGVSWRFLVGGVGAVAFVTGILFLVLEKDRRPAPRPASPARTDDIDVDRRAAGVWHHTRAIVRERSFWLFSIAMFCGAGAEGAFTFWSASYIQLNFDALARAGAIGTAMFAGGMAVGRFASGRFVHQGGIRILIIASALVGVVASLGAWAVESVGALYAVIFAAGLSIACFWPSIQSYAATVIPLDSTTLFILLSCFGIPGFGLTSWVMGIIASTQGLRTSLLVIPGLLVVLSIVMIMSAKPAAQESEPGLSTN